jgi:hypothetical protein
MLSSRYQMRRKATIALASSILIAGCTSGTSAATDEHAVASGAAVKTLDAGKVDSLPSGGVFVRVIEFDQPELNSIQSRQHVAGFVYVESGVHRLTLEGSAPLDLPAGTAKFHGDVSHTHYNPGPGPSVWYFIAVWPTSARGQPPVAPIAKPQFESNDFPPEQLPPSDYSQVLRQVTLAPSGRSEAHKFGGLSLFFVIDGTLTIQTDRGPVTLQPDQGSAYGPGVALQELNRGSSPALYLEMLTTAPGKEFEIPLPHSPGG